MSNLVKRLRETELNPYPSPVLMREAADRITALEAENKRLRSELLADKHIEYNDWTPSKGGRLG